MPGQISSRTDSGYPTTLHVIHDTDDTETASAITALIKHQAAMGAKLALAEMGRKSHLDGVPSHAGIHRISLGIPSKRSFIKIVADVVKVIRRKNIRVIHSHDITSGIYAAIAGIKERVPVVLSCRDVEQQGNRSARILRKLITLMGVRTVCATPQIMKQALDEDNAPGNKTLLIIDGVDLYDPRSGDDRRCNARANLGLSDDDLVLMVIGEFSEPFGELDKLIRAVSQLTSSNRNLRLVLVGDGPFKFYLEKLVTALVLDKYVRFIGELDSTEDVINAADCFVSVSDEYRCINHTLKAMACSLPVVSYAGNGNIGGLIIDGVNGIVVDSNDVDTMADELNRVISQPDFASTLGAAGRRVVENRFTWEKVCAKYLQVYQEAQPKRNKRYRTSSALK